MLTTSKTPGKKTSTAVASTTTNPTLQGLTNWYPVMDANLASTISSPAAYQTYLQELVYFGQTLQNLGDPNSWVQVSATDDQVVYEYSAQVGNFTMTGTPTTAAIPDHLAARGAAWAEDDTLSNYLFEIKFTGTASNVTHSTMSYLQIGGGGVSVLTAIAGALIKFWPAIMSKIGSTVSAEAENAVADAAEVAGEAAAEEAAEVASISLGAALGAIGGVAAAVIGLTTFIIEMLEKDFQLVVSIVNQSSTDYLVIPNYYVDYGQLTGASNSCAYLSNNSELPATICSDSSLWPFSPHAQMFNGQYVQASEYQFVIEEDGLAAPGILAMLVECAYAPPASGASYGTLTPTEDMAGWTGFVANPHYHTDDAPNLALFTGGQNLGAGEGWYKQYEDATPASTGSYNAKTTTLSWTLAQGDPTPDRSAGGALTWHITITITDNQS